MKIKDDIKEPNGKLGILTPGMGAVSTTFMAGVIAVNKGLGKPIGSITQLGKIRLGKRTENRNPNVNDFVPLTQLKDIVFGGWDIFHDNNSFLVIPCAIHSKNKKILELVKSKGLSLCPISALSFQ